jgi:RHS repeat-associated protein
LTTDELGQTYKYDAWNRLVQVKNSGGTVIASYAYDGLGRRIQETHGGTVNDFYYSSAWQVLEERTGGVSTATVQYVWSPVYVDALVLRDRSTQNNGTLDERLWVQQDANWNVTALVNSSGSVVERYIYDPYGQVSYLSANWSTNTSSAYGWIYNHQGGRRESATGNYNFRHRDYRPTLQRWLELDPIGIGGGDTNFYRAEGNNPGNHIDPSGLRDDPAGDAKTEIDGWVDDLHWPDKMKGKIKDGLHRLIDAAQFDWFPPTGALGRCESWVDQYYAEAKPILADLEKKGLSPKVISVGKIEWNNTTTIGAVVGAGHAAVKIQVFDAPGSKPNKSFVIYLDDGHVGGGDHVFVDNELPAFYSYSAGYPWSPKDSDASNGVAPPDNSNLMWATIDIGAAIFLRPARSMLK